MQLQFGSRPGAVELKGTARGTEGRTGHFQPPLCRDVQRCGLWKSRGGREEERAGKGAAGQRGRLGSARGETLRVGGTAGRPNRDGCCSVISKISAAETHALSTGPLPHGGLGVINLHCGSGSKGGCCQGERQKLQGLFWPSLRCHAVSLLLYSLGDIRPVLIQYGSGLHKGKSIGMQGPWEDHLGGLATIAFLCLASKGKLIF